MGVLIYRVKYAESRTDITSVIKNILPCDLVKIQSNYEWKKDIVKAYNKDSGMSPDEAKVAFLKVIYRWPTYGSAFFEANQVSDPSFPEQILVAINKQGVSIIHMQSKVGTYYKKRIAQKNMVHSKIQFANAVLAVNFSLLTGMCNKVAQ